MAVRFHADLHIHSKYSRACSKDCDLEHLAWWARRKGITVVGTGDFTHPAWFEHLRDNLIPSEPGLFRLKEEVDEGVRRDLPPSLRDRAVRFALSVEISTIYKYGDRTRKIHHLVYLPDLDAAAEFNRRLGSVGNIGSDGRPILGLDSRDLLEIALESSPDGYLVPAHVWTPWFGVLGSKAGFDVVAEAYRDLADHVFALETGLSADPEMFWRISGLDRYQLVSHSDAHSPPMLGRESTVLDTDVDYYAIKRALATGEGLAGTVEFFPEEGKYHVDGHRKCGIWMEPSQTRRLGSLCPECGKPLTVGVLSRVEELADRPLRTRPEGKPDFTNLVPLPEIIGEIAGVGPKSKTVRRRTDALVAEFGPELSILEEVPVADLTARDELLGEAIARLRRGEVIRQPGYDGEYGVIRLFDPKELRWLAAADVPALFDEALFGPAVAPQASPQPARVPRQRDAAPADPVPLEGSGSAAGGTTSSDTRSPSDAGRLASSAEPLEDNGSVTPDGGETADPEPVHGILGGLDPEQRAAAAVEGGPLLIIAGPGTGKTRTLTHRIAHLVAERGVDAARILAITFTRRAAAEMAERLSILAPRDAESMSVTTFHSLGLRILREHPAPAGLPEGFGIAETERRLAVAARITGDAAEAKRLLADGRRCDDPRFADYLDALHAEGMVDLDDLIALPVELLEGDPELAAAYRERYRWVFVDEYQDIDERQYRLLRLLVPADGNLTAIGDPDQAIYRFRGADVGFFLRFQRDFPNAALTRLSRNYRSGASILAGAIQVVAPTALVADRRLDPHGGMPDAPIRVHGAASESAEASFVANTIDRLLGGATFTTRDAASHDSATELGFNDIAVLYRTDAQSRAIAEALTRAGFPFQKRSHDRLRDRPGVADLLGELRFADDASTVHKRLLAAADALRERPEADPAVLDAAVDLLTPLALRCDTDSDRFRDELSLGIEVDTWDPRADRISLLTLHASKGLEFPCVFVVGCEDGLLPLRWGETSDEEIAEERRLLFVGMTRAQRHLHLSHAAERYRHGSVRAAIRSPFLSDLDARLTETVAAPKPKRPKVVQPRLI